MKIIDLEPYRPHIDKFDLNEEEKLGLDNAIIEVVLEKCFTIIKKNEVGRLPNQHLVSNLDHNEYYILLDLSFLEPRLKTLEQTYNFDHLNY